MASEVKSRLVDKLKESAADDKTNSRAQMGRAGSGPEFHDNSGSGRAESLHLWVGLGRVEKMDLCPTLGHGDRISVVLPRSASASQTAGRQSAGFTHLSSVRCIYLNVEDNMTRWRRDVNPLVFRDNYSATSNNMKLVHWPLMGGLLHLVQRGGDWAGPQPAQAPPRCTKCNSPPINGQCTNHCIAV